MAGIEAWIVLAGFCFIGEMLTTSFFLLWFGVGASIAAVLNYLGFDPMVQIVAFILISIVLLAVSRPLAQKITKEPPRKAASDRLIGKHGIVIEDILPDTGGVVKVEGDVWRAISPKTILKDNKIIVKKIESVKLYVVPVESE
ncbi:MAG: NfeD family protein [Methanobacterium sp.]|jgi:membrane protein implicated in regulation of membrane protease activity|nr:NfeD family protein [Methanobacterium sp.]